MSRSAQPYGFFPAAPSAPHAFNIFSFSHTPRENHALYEDLRNVYATTAESDEENSDAEFGVRVRSLKKSTSMPSFKDSLRKLFRMG